MLSIVILVLVIVIVCYFYAICPRIKNRPEINPFQGWLYAHRGIHDNETDCPENCKRAFEKAIALGYGIELDVQLTKDRVPVIFHDQTLKRVCNREERVCDLMFEELEQLHLCKSEEKIPRFDEVMKLIDAQVPVIIEIKMYTKDGSVNQVVAKILDEYPGVYCIESFNPMAIRWWRKNRPQVMRGQLSANFIKGKEPGNKLKYFCWQNLLFNFLTKPDFIAYNYKEDYMLSFRLCRKLYHVIAFAWTIKSEEAKKQASKWFDFFIFDSFLPLKREE